MAKHSRFDQAVYLAARGVHRPRLPLALVLLMAAAGGACRSGDVQEKQAAPTVINLSAQQKSRGVKAEERKPPFASAPWHIPVGPTLSITPGKGVGPIRFGAHLDTIERLIGEACQEKREEGERSTCRYSAQAIEFVLVNGGVTEIRAHRLGRPFEPNKPDSKADYGIFNGRFESGVAFGMVPGAVEELMGKPKATRTVEGENPNHTTMVYEYDGVTLEFDRISKESVVLGGAILTAPKAP